MGGALHSCGSRALLSALLLALLLCRVPCGLAAPALQPQSQEAGTLSKIYPRGSHWAVGHLMGKKSTGEFPYSYDGGDKGLFSDFPENHKQLERCLQREETLKNLLRLLDGNENRSGQFAREDLPSNIRKSWDTEDNSNLKEMLDYLFQVMNMKENTPS
ncbi:gastrin-releasing peptide [Ambystoma mexicanum]|uniref:gastrin-releasing peptide n=1 Tax=Ambystoma mexicanum TaxID=8296 RepID=UPI0037E8BAE4